MPKVKTGDLTLVMKNEVLDNVQGSSGVSGASSSAAGGSITSYVWEGSPAKLRPIKRAHNTHGSMKQKVEDRTYLMASRGSSDSYDESAASHV